MHHAHHAHRGVIFTVLALLLISGTPAHARPPAAGACLLAAPDGPEYYAIELVPTRTLPGLKRAQGAGRLSYARTPFGISISPEGHYVYDLQVQIENLRAAPDGGEYVVWIATANLDRIKRVGALNEQLAANAQVKWNKFLVVVTLERAGNEAASTWQGPIVMRGLSRSGLMHTMAGHGPFQQEPCAQYGY